MKLSFLAFKLSIHRVPDGMIPSLVGDSSNGNKPTSGSASWKKLRACGLGLRDTRESQLLGELGGPGRTKGLPGRNAAGWRRDPLHQLRHIETDWPPAREIAERAEMARGRAGVPAPALDVPASPGYLKVYQGS
jgi:hypothetical protein